MASVFINPLCVSMTFFYSHGCVWWKGSQSEWSPQSWTIFGALRCRRGALWSREPVLFCPPVITLSRGAVFSGWNTTAHVDSGHFTGIGRWPVCDTRVCVYCHVKTCRLLWVKHVCYTAAAKIVSITNSRETKLKKVIKAGESEAMCAWEILMCTVKLL